MNVDEKRICEELWDKYKDKIHKVCEYKLKSHPSEIEDVVAEVYYALCKKVHESGVPEKPKEWLYGVFYNVLNGKYREIYARRDHEVSFPEDELDLPFRFDTINRKENEIFVGELRKEFDSILDNEDNALLNYIYYDDLKLKEIAAKLNKSEAAVKQKRYRIFQKLRKHTKRIDK